MMAVTNRAIRSAPPPVPAGMTNSTGFVGCQAASAERGAAVMANVAPRRKRDLPIQPSCLMVSSPDFFCRDARDQPLRDDGPDGRWSYWRHKPKVAVKSEGVSPRRRVAGRTLPTDDPFPEGQAGGRSSSTCMRKGITPGTSHLVHIWSILDW